MAKKIVRLLILITVCNAPLFLYSQINIKVPTNVKIPIKKNSSTNSSQESNTNTNTNSNTSGAVGDKQKIQEFYQKIKDHKQAIEYFDNAFEEAGSSAWINQYNQSLGDKYLVELKMVDSICKHEYPDLKNNPSSDYYCKPELICGTASAAPSIAANSIQKSMDKDLDIYFQLTDDAIKNLNANGWLSPTGNVMYNLIYDRPKGKSDITKSLEPKYAAAGKTIPSNFFDPLDKKLDELWQKVDENAPKYSFPDLSYHDEKAENIAKKQLKGVEKVLKTAMLYPDYSISKNDLGVPLSRYHTGVILYKMPGDKWCRYREFTYSEQYAGGGTYAPSSTVKFSEAIRFQKCE